MVEPARILAVDDNEEALFVLAALLEKQGYAVTTASDGAAALRAAEAVEPDVVLLDIQMPKMDGVAVAQALKQDRVLRYVPVVLMTALEDTDTLVRGLDAGADDFLRKPFESTELLARVRAALRTRQTYRDLRAAHTTVRMLQDHAAARSNYGNIVGKSAALVDVFRLLDQIKDANVPVLVLGESGTGKELIARAIHFNSPRAKLPFVVQNCSALNDNLLESELFGHVRGAFTGAVRDKEGLFALADRGTFFLDELGEMSPALQVKLLRVIQQGTFTPVGGSKEQKVDVRIVAATNRDLQAMVRAGTFREDLYYRLNVVTVQLPPLRSRRVDIPLLCQFFLENHCKKHHRDPKLLSEAALMAVCDYDWPGNIRELENELERLVLLSGDADAIGAELLSPHIGGSVAGMRSSASVGAPAVGDLKRAVTELERQMIGAALEQVKGNKSEVARLLGISRSSLIAKVQEYRLESEK